MTYKLKISKYFTIFIKIIHSRVSFRRLLVIEMSHFAALPGWYVLVAIDGQIRSELVGVIDRHRRMYLGRLDLRCGSISRRRAADDRTS